MFKNYSDVMTACTKVGKFTISVAVAQDEDVLNAVKMASEYDLADALLVGDETKITPILEKLKFINAKVIHEPDDQLAVKRAVSLIRDKQADVLMKGLINSSDFMRAVLDSNSGLKKGSLLSHLAVYEIPGQRKLFFMTDGGLNINPDLNEKRGILLNAIDALERMGIDNPKVAILSANEKVNSKMQSTVDAKALVEMREKGEIPTGFIEGPIALDVAISKKAAEHKGIKSEISEDVDLYMVHNIDAGNLLGKTLMYYANAKMAGLVLGAVCPIVLTSRAETSEGKLNSIAMANLLSRTKMVV
ncbi:MAG: phosphate butyryltransferase [Clostridiales bacterium GWC2_40_7]|nr:MAG: phosphate butyryltransferase [Clostridiales bacterium GWC2_40_7]